jgi:hypothetical protein
MCLQRCPRTGRFIRRGFTFTVIYVQFYKKWLTKTHFERFKETRREV